jgi:hypothetical protein
LHILGICLNNEQVSIYPPPLSGPNSTAGAFDGTVDAAALVPGRAVYWGKEIVNQDYMLVPPEAAKGGNILAVASGRNHVVALTKAGKVIVWEDTDEDVPQFNKAIPEEVNSVGAKAVAAGDFFSIALLNNGKVTCWGSGDYEGKVPCRVPAFPTSGPGAVVKLAAYEDIAVATAGNGNHYFWAVREKLDATKEYHVLSQPGGISRVIPWRDVKLLVVDGAGKLAARTNPYNLPWPLQLSSSVKAVCSGGRRYAAALTNDGRVTVSRSGLPLTRRGYPAFSGATDVALSPLSPNVRRDCTCNFKNHAFLEPAILWASAGGGGGVKSPCLWNSGLHPQRPPLSVPISPYIERVFSALGARWVPGDCLSHM